MPDIYSDMTGPAVPEQTTSKKQCSPSHKSASLEPESEKEKGDLEGQPQKPKGCQGAESYNLIMTGTQTAVIYTALGLTGSRTQLLEINTLFINVYIYIYVYMYTHTYPYKSIHIYTHTYRYAHTYI